MSSQPYNEPCRKCGSTNQLLMITNNRKSIFCNDCKNFNDIYVSSELQKQWNEEVNNSIQSQQPINIPKCPTCQSTNINKITLTSKAINTAIFGLLGTKRHKTFHCNNCDYEW